MARGDKWMKKYESMRAATKRVRAKAGETGKNVLHTGESAGTGFLLGMMQGRAGEELNIAGFPVSLGVGIVAHAFAFWGVGKGMDSHFRAVGDGGLTTFTVTKGMQIGTDMAARQGVSGDPGRVQILGDGSPSDYNEYDLQGAGLTEDQLVYA